MTRQIARRASLFDRFGTDAGPLLIGAGWGAAIAFVATCIAIPTLRAGGMTLGSAVGVGLLVGLGCGLVVLASAMVLPRLAADGVLAFLQPSGASCAYEHTFSREEALVTRGHVDAALASYEQLVLADAGAVQPRLRAADLLVRERRDLARAVALYREVQDVPRVAAGDFVRATNRLVDLHLGPLAAPGEALRELRRLADRYPDSEVAAQARDAIARLKREMTFA